MPHRVFGVRLQRDFGVTVGPSVAGVRQAPLTPKPGRRLRNSRAPRALLPRPDIAVATALAQDGDQHLVPPSPPRASSPRALLQGRPHVMTRYRMAWLGLGLEAWMLGVEASTVIARRTIIMAAGGPAAEHEAVRMVTEKIDAGLALQARACRGDLGVTPMAIASGALTHYRRKVRANRRRLARP